MFGGMGITAGAHRLWAHRTYKANYKLRLLLAMANLIAFQNCIFDWVNKVITSMTPNRFVSNRRFPVQSKEYSTAKTRLSNVYCL